MNWKQHKQNLLDSKDISFSPKGNLMKPKINSGDKVTVSPINDIKKGDIVFCKDELPSPKGLLASTTDLA